MGQNSSIEWTSHTFNPWVGCSKVSEACRNCYAESWAARYRPDEGLWGSGRRSRTSASNWADPLRWHRAAIVAGHRPRVFCASLADVFEARDDLDPIRADLWALIEECYGLDWLLLSKRPDQIRRRVPARWLEPGGWPAHVWVGTTAENQRAADERIPHLLGVPAPVRFLSMEPLLGPVDLARVGDDLATYDALRGGRSGCVDTETGGPRISWVIVGGESGAKARPMHPDWARSLRAQCVSAGVPFFFKQWGEWAPTRWRDAHAEVWSGPIGEGRMCLMGRVGKTKSGRMLDGRTWDDVPNGEAT